MRALILLLAAAGLAFGIYLGMHHAGKERAVPVATLPSAPELSLQDLNGSALHTADYSGRVVLVNFWAAWCAPCAEEVPQFIALQKKYQDQGLQVIGFSVDDDATELRDFYRKHQVNYPVVPSDIKIADAFGGVLGLPTTFLIGRDGKIHDKYNGATNFAVLEQEVVRLMKQ
ncbi:MAG TPA: TlpA disulfide reductase family protein [Candidatus Angelobacter sp.]|nr:TlpA disulfide reductase family protein [Candidatus Angelobacter sp.]